MIGTENSLPGPGGPTFITDGGLETTLIFQEGIDLPDFAAFVLLDNTQGRQELEDYYRHSGLADVRVNPAATPSAPGSTSSADSRTR